MGGSDQPKNTTTTTQVQLPSWLSSAYQNYLGQAQAFNSLPYQQYNGQTVAPPSAQQNLATGYAGLGATGALPSQQGQMNALGSVVNGAYNVTPGSNPYLGATTQVGQNAYQGNNPYLQSMISSSNKNITDAYSNTTAPQLAAQFAQGGAFGGSAYNQQVQNSQNTLAQNLANNTSGLEYQNYNQSAQLAQQQIQNQISAQQTDLARNAGIYQQGVQNQLSAAQQNAGNILNASQGITGANALQSQFLGQYGNLGSLYQQYQQGLDDQAANNWYNQNYGFQQSQLGSMGDVLSAASGTYRGQTSTAPNPAYQPRSLGGALTSAGGGAATGAAIGSIVPGIGTGIGAVAGGAAGLLGYYL